MLNWNRVRQPQHERVFSQPKVDRGMWHEDLGARRAVLSFLFFSPFSFSYSFPFLVLFAVP